MFGFFSSFFFFFFFYNINQEANSLAEGWGGGGEGRKRGAEVRHLSRQTDRHKIYFDVVTSFTLPSSDQSVTPSFSLGHFRFARDLERRVSNG